MKPITDTKLAKIIMAKCPNCEKGDVFNKRKKFFSIPQMKSKCELCGQPFEKEPGYFFGAMYVSYGLTVIQGLAIFIICRFLIGGIEYSTILITVAVIMVLLSVINHKLSRVIWLNIFP